MTKMPNLEHAIALAVKAHSGQTDKAGQAYILHPLRVMFTVEGETTRIVAIMHDVVEDTDYTFDDLREMGYSEDIIEALDCITRRDDETYERFIERSMPNPIARQVKIADLEDNMDVRRMGTPISQNDMERLERYRAAWQVLKSV